MSNELDPSINGALTDAERSARGSAGAFIDRLSERLGRQASVKAVFGEPIDRDGVTVIPVAGVRFAIGGGGGEGASEEGTPTGSGSGGGGGVMASPTGYIEITAGQARYVSIESPAKLWPLVLVGGITAWLALRGLKGLVR